MLDPASFTIGALFACIAVAAVNRLRRSPTASSFGPEILAAINESSKTMSAATDALTAAVKAQTAETSHVVAVLDDMKGKIDALIAAGNEDPGLQALADELTADTASVQSAEAKDDPGV